MARELVCDRPGCPHYYFEGEGHAALGRPGVYCSRSCMQVEGVQFVKIDTPEKLRALFSGKGVAR